ncbi:MAG: GNAT family acetyltransferase [Brevundimonas aurantiaca]|jgi:small-conductance mechanosensitive channel|uniref:GNAT family acetyltransferase n=1 Tax=Brevundimonas TaxID=41275 RepID=UPI000C8D8D7C|nr:MULTISPECIES: GNAT family acetyltransferase [Brevundimonas]MBB1180259.1 GNAT family acetyltransferase [Pseudomonas sp. FW305-3-2-15-E-TSA4]MEC7797759.1 GNAT family acetyltransferase [Pseudomonadota bacterium]MAL56533.1 GNAT family acetyltransferase [Brevundimonas sp.]MBA4787118.1 GNAT family acetyltransferase [Brevundimonas sp.]MCC4294649.1 GNAT family acetyltransferase [Brevundimonas aurantiaca]
MTYLTRAVFGGASLLLLLAATALIGFGVKDALETIRAPGQSGAEAVLDVLGYVIVAIAVFDVAKYIFEDEVRRGNERRSAAEARRSLTKFLSTIVIALFLEALVVVFKTAREDVSQLIYPTALLIAAVLVLVGLGAFQRFSASVEEKVGEDDEAEERRDAVKRKTGAGKS